MSSTESVTASASAPQHAKRKTYRCEDCNSSVEYVKCSKPQRDGLCATCYAAQSITCVDCQDSCDRADLSEDAFDAERCDGCYEEWLEECDEAENEEPNEGYVEVCLEALEAADGDEDAALGAMFATTPNYVPSAAENIRMEKAMEEAVSRYNAK